MRSGGGPRGRILIGDPFELAGKEIRGVVVDAEESSPDHLLFGFSEPVTLGGVPYPFAVLFLGPGNAIDRTGGGQDVSGIGLAQAPTSKEDAWGADNWRGGGLAFRATLILEAADE